MAPSSSDQPLPASRKFAVPSNTGTGALAKQLPCLPLFEQCQPQLSPFTPNIVQIVDTWTVEFRCPRRRMGRFATPCRRAQIVVLPGKRSGPPGKGMPCPQASPDAGGYGASSGAAGKMCRHDSPPGGSAPAESELPQPPTSHSVRVNGEKLVYGQILDGREVFTWSGLSRFGAQHKRSKYDPPLPSPSA